MIAPSALLRPFVLSALSLVVLPLAPAPAFAAAITIDFDALAAMGNSPGAPVPAINRVSDQFLLTTGAVFSSGVAYVAVVNHGDLTPSPPNHIGGVRSDNTLDYSKPITIRFFDPSNPTVPAETNFFSVTGDMFPTSDGTATLDAFDAFGQLLASVTQPDSNAGLTLSIALSGIHEVRISQNSPNFAFPGTIGFDDVTFNPVQAIPEPCSPLLFLTAVTFSVSRRHRSRRA
jgi:hypothetical protein